jgi:hypothetical protein
MNRRDLIAVAAALAAAPRAAVRDISGTSWRHIAMLGSRGGQDGADGREPARKTVYETCTRNFPACSLQMQAAGFA